ncbi:MAG: gamma-glutamylcyclotransferase [Planctomycetales bacterium]|nr:gamma-glutamylcyclotransferase [Planctomycetales bacterium]
MSSLPPRPTKIFIYGTLQRGHSRSGLLAGQRFLANVVTRPVYRLYDLGPHPGLVPDPHGNRIAGELWEVDPACLAMLDQIEDVPRLYRREGVTLEDYEEQEVQTYLYQGPVDGRPDCGGRWPPAAPRA